MRGYLLLRAEGAPYGFRVTDVEQVVDLDEVYPAPGVVPAVRGVAHVSGRLVPLVHLVALLTQGTPPSECRPTGVLTRCVDGNVVFEVDDVDAVVAEDPLPVPAGWQVPWASGVAPGTRLVPILDLAVLAERLSHASAGAVG
jgi:chemotaxis signal transduction protein